MKNKLIIAAGIAVATLTLAGCGISYAPSSTTGTGTPTPDKATNNQISTPTSNTPAAAAPQGQSTIVIKNFAFSPATLNVKVGATITWTNDDSATHTVKSDKFNSGNLTPGDKFQFTFTTPGTYNYSCGIHPSMTGQIVVQ